MSRSVADQINVHFEWRFLITYLKKGKEEGFAGLLLLFFVVAQSCCNTCRYGEPYDGCRYVSLRAPIRFQP
jgi:hypothetical protein